jgi:chromosome segregation ATPase
MSRETLDQTFKGVLLDQTFKGDLRPVTLEDTLKVKRAPSGCQETLEEMLQESSMGRAAAAKEPLESSSTENGKMLVGLEIEARKRRQENAELRARNSELQEELEQQRQAVELLRQNGSSLDQTGTIMSREVITVLETEARNRRQEISDLRDHNAQLQKELEEEREANIKMRQNSFGSTSSTREMLATVRTKETEARRDLEQELVKLRAQSARLEQTLEVAQAEAARLVRREVEVRRGCMEELDRLRADKERLQQELEATAAGAEAQREELQSSRMEKERMRDRMKTAMDQDEEVMSKLRAENAALMLNAQDFQKKHGGCWSFS